MQFTEQYPIRILHVVGGMNQGGLETWLMHILRHIDRDRFHIDFLVHTTQPCAYDDEIRSLGSQVIPCLHPSRPSLYAHNFKRVLSEYGFYDIIHSHVHHFSGYVLRLAQQAGVPVRIAHSHIDSSPLEAHAVWYRRFYLTLMKSLIARHATLGLGCSQLAIVDLFGSAWKSDPRWQLLYYGIDLTPFQASKTSIDVVDLRVKFDIPADAFVIGHVGRFYKQKNHQFLIEIFAEVAKREPRAYLLLVGEGPLRPTIEQQVMQLGLGKQVIFLGRRSDVPQLMITAMDVFLLPSLSEGLPMVGIEAQAAGLPLILSDVITDEVNQIKPLIQKISLSQPVKVWTNAVLATRNFKARITQTDTVAVLENSEFNISYSIKALTKIYVDECYKNCQYKSN
ncbi:MAG: glycosyltransferase family 1 protein [Fischerella sp. CENA71]|nr:glycosyltransferase family 1 protein [Fischerella sp. CENA71]